MTEYNELFYANRREMTLNAATTILGLVLRDTPVTSAVDIGCGTGTWLETALSLGARRVVGVEGPWVDSSMLDSDEIEFLPQSLEEPIALSERFDLAICMEVAEHLSPERGPGFVADLCGLSDVVLFSAAIPGQRGVGHINERWQSYWAGLFAQHGFGCSDTIRPAIWGDDRIPPWYQQNSLVYTKGTAGRVPMLDLVHPYFWTRKPRPPVKK